MANGPFVVTELPKGGFLSRLSGRAPREAAFVELRNMLARIPWHEVSPADVATTLARYKMLPADARSELTAIFADAAAHAVGDRELTGTEKAGLERLQLAFEFSANHTRAAYLEAARSLYCNSLIEALADGHVTQGERATLDRIAVDLGLTKDEGRHLYAEEALRAIQLFFDQVVQDKRFSPDEEERLNQIASALGVDLKHSEKSAALLDRYRMFGRIEAGQLPSVEVAILLQRAEVCHFMAENVVQKELRTVTKRVNYSGLSTSIKIMKGVRYRVGSITPQRITQDVMTAIDEGAFYVTSKRIFIQGHRKKTSVPLAKLVHFTVYSDGLQLQKGSGKDVYVTGAADWEVAGTCIDAAARLTR